MKLIIAAGGTGGHIFPGLAIREEFLARSENNQALFIGAVGGMEEELLKEEKVNAKFVRSGKFSGMSVAEKIQGLVSTYFGVFDSIKVIRQYMPDFVLGAGGYVSVPVLIAAWSQDSARDPGAEQLPGLSNRVLARISSRVFLSFESAEKYFPKVSREKFMVCGNPLRKKVLEQLAAPAETQTPTATEGPGGSRFLWWAARRERGS